MKLFFIGLMALVLSACGHNPPTPPAPAPTYVYVDVPAPLTKDCEVTKPPKEEKYVALTVEEKEKTLYLYSASLLGNLSECNLRLRALNNWNIQQKKIYTK